MRKHKKFQEKRDSLTKVVINLQSSKSSRDTNSEVLPLLSTPKRSSLEDTFEDLYYKKLLKIAGVLVGMIFGLLVLILSVGASPTDQFNFNCIYDSTQDLINCTVINSANFLFFTNTSISAMNISNITILNFNSTNSTQINNTIVYNSTITNTINTTLTNNYFTTNNNITTFTQTVSVSNYSVTSQSITVNNQTVQALTQINDYTTNLSNCFLYNLSGNNSNLTLYSSFNINVSDANVSALQLDHQSILSFLAQIAGNLSTLRGDITSAIDRAFIDNFNIVKERDVCKNELIELTFNKTTYEANLNSTINQANMLIENERRRGDGFKYAAYSSLIVIVGFVIYLLAPLARKRMIGTG